MYEFQEYPTESVLNLTGFGHALQQWCRREDMHEVLGGYGFMDGGCLQLALAIQSLLGPDQCQVRFICTGKVPQHAVAYLPAHVLGVAICLDADGLANEDELEHKMLKIERLNGPLDLRDVSLVTAARYGITNHDETGDTVRRHISQLLAPVLAPLLAEWPLGAGWLSPRSPYEVDRHRELLLDDDARELDPEAFDALLVA